jgi:thiamine-phosphate pyrophosphorylase
MVFMERAIYRIIDANFNRGREAARTMEEYCRFGLNSGELSSRAKGIRHGICRLIQRIEPTLLIASRDTDADVGCSIKVTDQLTRLSLSDCFTAASKRLSEALRVLAEMTQTIDPELAAGFEQLRFDGYALEKDTLAFSCTRGKFESVRLYILLTATGETSDERILDLARICAASGADCIQLRGKGITDRRALHLATEIAAICRRANVVSIINDRADLAVCSKADGVHLGQDDIDIAEARGLALSPLITGRSTHSIDQLNAAIAERPDYVALGPVFATSTKPSAEVVGLEYVKEALDILSQTDIPHVAIGGINLENLSEVLAAGVRTIAVSSAVMDSADPAGTCKAMKDMLQSR